MLPFLLLAALLWLDHNAAVELPRPAGPFLVGRTSTVWVDRARSRELLVWIWYPAEPSPRLRPAEYMPEPWRRALPNPPFLRNPANVRGHSFENAEIARASAAYPVVIFRSGIGALALNYSALVEDLASRGSIVVGADTPSSTTVVVMPDGRLIYRTPEGNPTEGRVPDGQLAGAMQKLIDAWTADNRFMADEIATMNASGRFAGRIDLAHLAAIGHSFGGATAAQFCHDDNRCRAGVDIDGRLFGSVVHDGIRQPFLFLMSDHRGEDDSVSRHIGDEIRSMKKPVVMLPGTQHFSFGDQSVTATALVRGLLRFRSALPDAPRIIAGFFDHSQVMK